MTDSSTSLEQAISAARGGDVENLRNVLQMLVTARIKVLLNKPWDGISQPEPDTRMLFVSDGKNEQQPMLALFTSDAFASEFQAGDNPFIHIVEVDARLAIHRVEPGTGIMINPNSDLSFRITPELAKTLRDEIDKQLKTIIKARSQA
ncbi:MAG: SseB family protein [Gammaproteobacteria bacterium]